MSLKCANFENVSADTTARAMVSRMYDESRSHSMVNGGKIGKNFMCRAFSLMNS